MAKEVKRKDSEVINYPTRSAGDIVENSYLIFGSYVNSKRQLPLIMDGLKPSYRRLILASYTYGPKFTKTAKVTSMTQTWHPHGITGMVGVASALIRSGVFDGSGNWGANLINGTSFGPAAERYTSLKISDTYYDIIGRLIKMVPWNESPMGDPEPDYLPTPLPLSLSFFSIMGLGIGVSTKLPNFSPVSMYEAYLNDDPSLLKANCNINIDIKESELDKIWYEGKGKVCYKYNIVRCVSDDGSQGVRIEGDTDIFLPKLKWFEQQQDQEKLFIREETDETGPKLFIGKNPNIRTISVDDIEEHAIKACRDCTTYSLNVTNGTQAFRIPLREWIKITYENYLTLVDKQKQQKIQDVEFNIKVAENTEVVANYIINENPKAENEEISQAVGCDIEIVNAIMSRSISNLKKNKDNSEKLKSLKSKLKEWKSLDPIKFIDEIVRRL